MWKPNDPDLWQMIIRVRQTGQGYPGILNHVKHKGLNHLSFRELISVCDSLADNDRELATRATAQAITNFFNTPRICDSLMTCENFPSMQEVSEISMDGGPKELYDGIETLNFRLGNTFTNELWRTKQIAKHHKLLNDIFDQVVWRLQQHSNFMLLWDNTRETLQPNNGSIWRFTKPYSQEVMYEPTSEL